MAVNLTVHPVSEYPRWRSMKHAEKWLEENNPHPKGTMKYYDFNIAFWDHMLNRGLHETFVRRLAISFGVIVLVWVLAISAYVWWLP